MFVAGQQSQHKRRQAEPKNCVLQVQSAAQASQRGSHGGSSMSGLSSMMPKSLAMRAAKSAPALDEAGLRTAVATCTGNWLSHLDWGSER